MSKATRPDALDLRCRIDAGIHRALLAVGQGGGFLGLAEIDPAHQFAHDQDIQARNDLGLEGRGILQRIETQRRAQIGIDAHVLAHAQQAAFGALRERLGIARMGEIWTRDDEDVFEQVAAAERDGARHGADIAVAVELVESSDGFAVLTDNSASAVAVFLERHGELAHPLRRGCGSRGAPWSQARSEDVRAAASRCA